MTFVRFLAFCSGLSRISHIILCLPVRFRHLLFRLAVFKKTEYKAIPCLIVTLDGEVKYVGSESKGFRAALEEAVKAAPPKEE